MITANTEAMKMFQTKSLSLSGGHIVSEQMPILLPSYSPNAVSAASNHFPWEEDVNEINTPDIDPSFFDSDPFKLKMKSQTSVDPFAMAADDQYFAANPNSVIAASEDSSQTQSYEDMNLNQLLSQTNVDINGLLKEPEAMVAPNDVLDEQFQSTSPVLHYLQPKTVDVIPLDVITSQPMVVTTTAVTTHFTSPSHSSSSSYSPSLSTINHSYLSPSPSPALSYTSTVTSSPATLISLESMPSETQTTTIEGMLVDSIDQKPDLEFLQPTVINDHLYSQAVETTKSSTQRRRKSSADSKDKYTSRKKNNVASKKSRVTKRDKQKLMEEQIQHYLEDNEKCRKQIEQMEREIEWCKNFLFKKVVASARSS